MKLPHLSFIIIHRRGNCGLVRPGDDERKRVFALEEADQGLREHDERGRALPRRPRRRDMMGQIRTLAAISPHRPKPLREDILNLVEIGE